jgi:hypothetical protein
MSEHSKNVTILLDGFPGLGRQLISRVPPHSRFLGDCLLIPNRRLGRGSSLHETESKEAL